MITLHIEKDDGVIFSGYFAGDFGGKISSFEWNGEDIKVDASDKTRRVSLAQFDMAQYSDEELRKRIIDIAKSTAEDLRGEPFPA